VKVGDTIWQFDANRRVYTKVPGKPFGGVLIRKAQWVPRTITGETSRSWIVAAHAHDRHPAKVPKTGPHRDWAFTQREVDLDVFRYETRGELSSRMNLWNMDDEVYVKVAKLLGIQIPPELEDPTA